MHPIYESDHKILNGMNAKDESLNPQSNQEEVELLQEESTKNKVNSSGKTNNDTSKAAETSAAPVTPAVEKGEKKGKAATTAQKSEDSSSQKTKKKKAAKEDDAEETLNENDIIDVGLSKTELAFKIGLKDGHINITSDQLQHPDFISGDTITVHYKIREGNKLRIQQFKGVVLQRKGHGSTETMTIRKVSGGIGVERIIPVHSPFIDKIELDKPGKVRRARIFYLRGRKGKSARIEEKR